jgi:hypothetical protein
MGSGFNDFGDPDPSVSGSLLRENAESVSGSGLESNRIHSAVCCGLGWIRKSFFYF